MYIANDAQNKLYSFYFQGADKGERFWYEKGRPLFMFALVGAFGWAIRGTGGWGGMSGAFVAGFWWASLFYFLAKIRGVDARWQFFGLGFGIGFGGMTGYGQFISWIKGNFLASSTEIISINPTWGWVWLALVGFEWGGMAAGFLSWTLKRAKNPKEWAIRTLIPAACATLLYFAIKLNLDIFAPAYSDELYLESECSSLIYCGRTIATLPLLAIFIGLTIGFIIAETILKNKIGLKVIGIMALGFTIAFPLSALWFFGELESFGSWWKLWEESIGLIGGISIGIVFLFLMKKIQAGQIPEAVGNPEAVIASKGEISDEEKQKIKTRMDFRAHLILSFGILILMVNLIQAIRQPFLSHFSWYQLMDADPDWVADPNDPLDRFLVWVGNLLNTTILWEEIIFLVICYLIIMYFFFKSIKISREKINKGTSTFPIRHPIIRFMKLSLFIAFCGMIAIYPGYMTIFYALFTGVLLYQLLTFQEFFRSKNLIPDEYL